MLRSAEVGAEGQFLDASDHEDVNGAGGPGDEIKRDGSAFFVGSQYIGVAKPRARTGEPLEAAAGGLIPEGEYFLATPSPDSLDSRYAVTGNVKQREIIGKAYELF